MEIQLIMHISGFQRGHRAMPGDIFGCHHLEGGMLLLDPEVREAAKHPTNIQGTSPSQRRII